MFFKLFKIADVADSEKKQIRKKLDPSGSKKVEKDKFIAVVEGAAGSSKKKKMSKNKVKPMTGKNGPASVREKAKEEAKAPPANLQWLNYLREAKKTMSPQQWNRLPAAERNAVDELEKQEAAAAAGS